MFWVYFVGFALVAASLSIATKRQARWSGLLLGAMMFLFVAMLHLPGAVTAGGRLPSTIVVREMSFGGAGWVLAGIAMGRDRDRSDLFWRSALSASDRTSQSSSRETDARLDSRSCLHRLSDGRVSHGCRQASTRRERSQVTTSTPAMCLTASYGLLTACLSASMPASDGGVL